MVLMVSGGIAVNLFAQIHFILREIWRQSRKLFDLFLGVIDKESPFTVRLLFEPSGRPMPDADYYTTCKENICVVCGNTGNFVRKMIIPHDYRRHFPQQMKDHMSHDVLLMCLDCHRLVTFFRNRLQISILMLTSITPEIIRKP